MAVTLTNVTVALSVLVLFFVFMGSMTGVGWEVGELSDEQRLRRQRSVRRAWVCIVLTFAVSIVAIAVMRWYVLGASAAGVTLGIVQLRTIQARMKALANRQRRLERSRER